MPIILSEAESYTLSELPEGYAIFHMRRKTETGATAGRVKAENAIYVRIYHSYQVEMLI